MFKSIKFKFFIQSLLIASCSNLAHAGQNNEPYRICSIYPHLKDSYWLSVNYGMVNEAEQQGIDLRVLESGGYPNHIKQKEQLYLCTRWDADAIILGTVAPDLYTSDLKSIVGSTPVFATVNRLLVDDKNKPLLKGEVGVDWYWMGYAAGKYLSEKHPKGSGKIKAALLPGPNSSGGTKPVVKGLYDALKNSDVIIAKTLWADNDKELQRNLIQQAIDTDGIRYIIGSAVAIEAGISELRASNKASEIGLISTYLSHGVYRGLLRHKVEFAPTDKMVEQGRLSLNQAIDYLRGKTYKFSQSPSISPLTPDTLSEKVIADSLSPSEYRPTFYINQAK
ncbi:TMAO reductase system periplasmic protein TorT [Vibrio sp. TRT 21S02]|uniref:TMAO reductase system periplasmic protein TorT n=1 Tax=unclassified Vibrio TaxID=2614977 RepID=UPI00349F1D93